MSIKIDKELRDKIKSALGDKVIIKDGYKFDDILDTIETLSHDPIKDDLFEYLSNEGYTNLRIIPGKGICGIRLFMFTYGLIFNIDPAGYEGRYCFKFYDEAKDALNVWNGEGDPSGDWIKYKGEGGERSNPNYTK